jgi:YVTN family beta-propeller protein
VAVALVVFAACAGEAPPVPAHARWITRHFPLGVGRGPRGIAYCRGRVFVALERSKSLGVIDPTDGSVIELALGGAPAHVACVGAAVAVALYDTREVVVYQLDAGTLRRLALPPEAEGPAHLLALGDDTLLAADEGHVLARPWSDRVFALDLAGDRVAAAVSTVRGAHGLAARDDGGEVYVTGVVEGSVAVVDPAAWRVLGAVSVGHAPHGVGFWRPP